MDRLTVQTPASAVLSTANAKLQCRIDADDENDLIDAYVLAAMDQVEQFTGRPVAETVYELTLDQFPPGSEPLLFPRPPLISVDSITYTDASGNAGQTLTPGNLQIDTSSTPGRMMPARLDTWPDVYSGTIGAVVIRFTAGDSSPPAAVLQAIRLAVAGWYENREDVSEGSRVSLPNGFDRLLRQRVFRSQKLLKQIRELSQGN